MMGRVRLAVRAKAWSPSMEEWVQAAQAIQPEEKQRIGRFVFQREAKCSMIGRLLIRKVVSEALGIPWAEVRLSRTEKGKPLVNNALPPELSAFSFNISHQGELVVMAAEPDRSVGVDVMKAEVPRMKPTEKFFDTMRRQLTAKEWEQVYSRDSESGQLRTFYRLWCLKESIVKAWGTGIGFEVSRLDFHMPTIELSANEITADTSVRIDGEPAPEWLFEETMVDDHSVAVAVNRKGSGDVDLTSPPHFQILTPAELLRSAEPLDGSTPDPAYWETFAARAPEPGRPKPQ